MGDGDADSRDRIMDATYRALIETGYADLTMSTIAEKSETSTSLLHYHFDTKEDLLVAFLDHLVDGMEADLASAAEEDPVGRLYEILSWYVLERADPDREAFHIALLELRSQAPYNERYRARFRRADRLIRRVLTEILEDGIDAGIFRSVDPEDTARLLIATIDGGRTRQIALGDETYSEAVRETVHTHVLDDVFTDEARDRWRELIEK